MTPLAAWTGLPAAPGPAVWGIGPGQQDAHEFLLKCLEQTGIAHRYSFEAAVGGQGHLVALASEPTREGATLEETAESWAATELPLGRCSRLLLYLPGTAWDRLGPRGCTPVWADGAGARPLTLRPGCVPDWRPAAIVAHSGAREAGHYVAYVSRGRYGGGATTPSSPAQGPAASKLQRASGSRSPSSAGARRDTPPDARWPAVGAGDADACRQGAMNPPPTARWSWE